MKRWKPKNGEDFWYIADDGVVCQTYMSAGFDVRRYKIGNCFKTRRLARMARRHIKEAFCMCHIRFEIIRKWEGK